MESGSTWVRFAKRPALAAPRSPAAFRQPLPSHLQKIKAIPRGPEGRIGRWVMMMIIMCDVVLFSILFIVVISLNDTICFVY